MKPLLIAHRGDTRKFGENSLEAFWSAFDRGADGVELDVQWYRGELIVVHDYEFDRNLKYPLLKEVLSLFGDRGRLEIELKSFSLDIIAPVKRLLADHPEADVELTSQQLPLVSLIADEIGGVSVGAIFGKDHYQSWMSEETLIRKTVELMEVMGAKVGHVSQMPFEVLSARLVGEMHGAGLKVHYHISEMEMERQVLMYERLGELEVDQCTFDDIGLLELVS